MLLSTLVDAGGECKVASVDTGGCWRGMQGVGMGKETSCEVLPLH